MSDDGKIDKASADYRDYPKGREMCAGCSMFRGPERCTLVRGVISPDGWCKHWERRTGGRMLQ